MFTTIGVVFAVLFSYVVGFYGGLQRCRLIPGGVYITKNNDNVYAKIDDVSLDYVTFHYVNDTVTKYRMPNNEFRIAFKGI